MDELISAAAMKRPKTQSTAKGLYSMTQNEQGCSLFCPTYVMVRIQQGYVSEHASGGVDPCTLQCEYRCPFDIAVCMLLLLASSSLAFQKREFGHDGLGLQRITATQSFTIQMPQRIVPTAVTVHHGPGMNEYFLPFDP